MCGRTCLTLEPAQIQCACSYVSKNDDSLPKEDRQPEWNPVFNAGKKYQPSYNIAPTDVTPVLVSSSHFEEGSGASAASERVLVPMMWGLIPYWHKGDYKKHGLTTNNCRLEGLLTSKLYQRPFKKGQRCVILCEGFYEWQTTKEAKSSDRAAYYIYMPQKQGIKIENPESWKCEEIDLLKVAGLFDVWTTEEGDQIFSYTVITYESDSKLSWLHHRTPAILETDDQVADWLDFNRVPDDRALKVLTPPKSIVWHPISNLVNNSRNKSDQCNKPLGEVKFKPKSKMMDAWLVKKRKPTDDVGSENKDTDDPKDQKKLKVEN